MFLDFSRLDWDKIRELGLLGVLAKREELGRLIKNPK
jgi:hypothetical protein